MTETDKDDLSRVEACLEEWASEKSAVPDALTRRVLADAHRLQPAQPDRARRRGQRQGWLVSMGGWPALGGLVAASCVGFWFGMTAPEGFMGTTVIGDMPGWVFVEDGADWTAFGWDIQEG